MPASPMSNAATRLVAQHPGQSGVYLLDDSLEALSSRLILADRAAHTIDVLSPILWFFLLLV